MTKISKRTRLQLFIEILKDPERKPLFLMIFEFFNLLFTYKEFPRYYFSRYLYKKGMKNVRNYLPNKLIMTIAPFFNDQKVKEVIDNKLYFDLFYRQFNISLPKILMYNHKKLFIVCNDCNKNIEVNNVQDFKVLLEEIFKQDSSGDSIFIKKTYSSASGRNAYKLFLQQIREDTEILQELYSEIINSEFLFQETVRQHPDLNKLTTASLNTIRFDTFIDSDGKVDIISSLLKMSTNKSHVDNTMSGGCMVGVKLPTGTLKKFGYSKIKISGCKVLTEHPITKTQFEDLSIPYFSQAKELVIKAAGFIPGLRLVGWDMAIGESGPVLIEGNSDYGIKDNDLLDGGYFANDKFRKVLHEINGSGKSGASYPMKL